MVWFIVSCASDPVAPAPSLVGKASIYDAVPGHAHGVLFVDHRALDADLGAANLLSSEDATAARKAQGFAMILDVHRTVMAAFPSATSLASQGPSSLQIHEGSFDDQVLRASDVAAAGRGQRFRGFEIWGSSDRALVRLDLARLAMGNERLLRDALDVHIGQSQTITSIPWFRNVTEALDEVWAGGRVAVELALEVTTETGRGLEPYLSGASTLHWLGLRAGGADQELYVAATAAARSRSAAGELASRWQSAADRIAARPQWQLLGVAQALAGAHIETRGNLVVATLTLKSGPWRDIRQRLGEVADYLRRTKEKGPH